MKMNNDDLLPRQNTLTLFFNNFNVLLIAHYKKNSLSTSTLFLPLCVFRDNRPLQSFFPSSYVNVIKGSTFNFFFLYVCSMKRRQCEEQKDRNAHERVRAKEKYVDNMMR